MTPNPAKANLPMDRPRRKRGWWGWTKLLLKLSAALFLLIATVALVAQAIFDRQALTAHPVPGRLVDLGGRKLHLIEKGSGPAVIFDAGAGGCSLDWSVIQTELSDVAHTVSYDRPGNGWSDPADAHSPEQIADDLHTALHRAGIAPPYVLAGYSAGGLYMQVFARRYPDEVSALVLVDSVHPDQSRRLAGLVPNAPWVPYVIAPFGVQRLLFKNGRPAGFDEATWAARSAMVMRSDSVRAVGGELRALGQPPDPTWMQPFDARLKLVVLTHSKSFPRGAPETIARIDHAWTAMQQELTNLSPQGRQEIVPNSSHGLPFEHPEAVVAAVKSVLRN